MSASVPTPVPMPLSRPGAGLTAADCMAALLPALPGFQAQWDDHLAAHPGEPADLTGDMLELAAYAHALLERQDLHGDALRTLFGLTETLLESGDAEVRAAVQAGFLEGLLYPLAQHPRQRAALLALLGPRSLAYARHWATVSGSALPGR